MSKIIQVFGISYNVVVFASGALINAVTSERFEITSQADCFYEMRNIDTFKIGGNLFGVEIVDFGVAGDGSNRELKWSN